jgi:hypothetical protein
MGDVTPALYHFLSGAAMFGAWTSGLFFFRFWSRSKDRLFLMFGCAFWLMAVERLILLALVNPAEEEQALVYLFRIAAFLLILIAIYDKNRRGNDFEEPRA